MKYTIELTHKQKAKMDCMMEIVHRYIGFNPKLEPIKTTNVEDTNEYQIGYKTGYDKGFEDGKADATYNTDLIDELKQVEYIRGLEDAKQILLNLLEVPSDERVSIFDQYSYYIKAILTHYSISEIQSRIKAYEEKKKIEEESIKVGDVIYSQMTDYKAIIISFNAWDEWNCIDTCGTGFVITASKMSLWKKIGHIDEVEQLLDKLRGEDNE